VNSFAVLASPTLALLLHDAIEIDMSLVPVRSTPSIRHLIIDQRIVISIYDITAS
jgi:hypothetical protein